MLLLNTDKPIFYVDMDDTLCDYQGEYDLQRTVFPKIKYPQSILGFFKHLEPLPNAIDGIQRLADKYETYILTRPSVKNIHCYSEKAFWVKEYLGEHWLDKLIINPHKGLMEAKGNWLIDDVKWNTFKGNQIMFKKDTTNWEFIIKMLNL